MDITLKSAFVISSMIHAAIAVPLYNNNLLRGDFVKKDPAIVDYIILKEISNITIANTGKKDTTVATDQDKIDIKNAPAPARRSLGEGGPTAAETRHKDAANHTRSEYLKRFEAAKLKEKKRELSGRPQEQYAQEAAKKEAQIRSSKDYLDYYGFLKEKIRARLQENYKFYKGEGDVYISFVLGSKGQLLSYSIDRSKSAKDEVLLHITGASLMAVSPFPPLPKILSESKMSFSITISFKK